MNRIRETRPAPRYGLLWAFVRRMLLLYAAWAVCRVIFYLMNASIIGPVGLNELPHLLRGSLAFDTASILYVNAPFILLSLLPFRFRERKGYQRMLLWLYSTVNGIALAINLSDGIYFHYARKRFTADELSYLGNNDNTGTVVLMPQALAETKALPALLADEGYSTSFFNGSGRGSMGFGAYATLAGVQRYYSREDYEKVCGTGDFDGYWGIWDEPFLQYMSRTLSETPEPFFASAFTLTSHHPFVVPERYADTLPKGKTKVHQGVAYTDMALKKFMETSSKEPWFRRTIFVFVADHVSSETFAPKTLTPTGNTRIVCLIYTPDGSVRGRHEGVVQQIDLMPTLLGLLGYDKPYFAFGRDVLHETGRTAMATNSAGDIYQGITDSLVLFFDGERTTSAYLRSDTLQRQDVSDRRTPLLEEAERQLKARLQQYYEHVERRDYLAPEQKTPPTGRAER